MFAWLALLVACVDPCPQGTQLQVDVQASGRTRQCLTPEGVRHGPAAAFDERGVPLWAGRYRDGEREGPWQWWSPAGSVAASGAYVDGQKDGLWLWLTPDNRLLRTGTYRSDRAEGLWQTWSPSGELVARSTFWTAGRVYEQSFYPNGALQEDGWRMDGLKEGVWRSWRLNGELQEERRYREGEPAGRWRTWYTGGRLASDRERLGGVTVGYAQRWSEDGTSLPGVAAAPSLAGGGFPGALPLEGPAGGWRFAFGGSQVGPAALIDDRVVITTGRMVFALRPLDGAVDWVAEAPAPLARVVPQPMGSKVAAVTEGGDLLLADRLGWELHDLRIEPSGPWRSDGQAIHFRTPGPESSTLRYDGERLVAAALPQPSPADVGGATRGRHEAHLDPTGVLWLDGEAVPEVAGARLVPLGAQYVAVSTDDGVLFVLPLRG